MIRARAGETAGRPPDAQPAELLGDGQTDALAAPGSAPTQMQLSETTSPSVHTEWVTNLDKPDGPSMAVQAGAASCRLPGRPRSVRSAPRRSHHTR